MPVIKKYTVLVSWYTTVKVDDFARAKNIAEKEFLEEAPRFNGSELNYEITDITEEEDIG